uniref:Uncharacterized protein n=1 Tax=Dunaliella tertiolecta TaxID=3047 RepID=A0A7S3R4M7_DUNTE|mmetsp:Transcript_5615/g.15103  ORF Transcript_5615/g.15103 Transcript_5615/m.15103 type:complete len:230 (-) Transcript_5615:29-718(-)
MPKGKGKEEGDDIEIVPSNQAIDMVASWLGLSAEQALPEQEDAPAGTSGRNQLQKRPKFLGLGATYVPHHKAVGFAAAIDERLKKRLESGSKRKAAQRLEEDGADAATQGQGNGPSASSPVESHKRSKHHSQQHRGSTLGHTASASGCAESSEDDEDDEKGKAAMVGRHKHLAPSAGPPGPGPNALRSKAEREALLFGGFSEPQGREKKRKNKKRTFKEGGTGQHEVLQ